MAIFLAGLKSGLSSQIHEQILKAETAPTLQSAFSRTLRISTATPATAPNQSAMISSTKGRVCGRSSRGGWDTHSANRTR